MTIKQTMLSRLTVLADLTALEDCAKGDHRLNTDIGVSYSMPEHCVICGEVKAGSQFVPTLETNCFTGEPLHA